MDIRLKTKEDIENLKISGKILSDVLSSLKENANVGVNLLDLDSIAKDVIKESGAKAAFYGFQPEGASKPFPGHICTSMNDEIVHGVPRDRVIKSGDVLTIDCGVDYNGYITDAAITLAFKNIPEEVISLIRTTEEALYEGINKCSVGYTLGDVGKAIQDTVTSNGYRIIKSLTGHGVGFKLHEPPTVFNYGNAGEGVRLTEGLVLAIEPITSISSEDIKLGDNDEFLTSDGSISAHFETTIVVTKNGPQVIVELP